MLQYTYINHHAENCPADQVTTGTPATPARKESGGKPIHAKNIPILTADENFAVLMQGLWLTNLVIAIH